MTTATATTLDTVARTIRDDYDAATRATRQARDDLDTFRRKMYEAEQEAKDEAAKAEAATKRALDLLRAIVNADEPAEPPPVLDVTDYGWRHDRGAAVTFASGRVTIESTAKGYTTKTDGPRKARAFAWKDRQTVGLYEGIRGTSDPDKLAVQYDEAAAALRAFLADNTAPAYLARLGIDPATVGADPGELLAIVPEVRADWYGGQLGYFVEYGAEFAGVTVAERLRAWDYTPKGEDGRRVSSWPDAPTGTDRAEWQAYGERHSADVRAGYLASLRRDKAPE